MSLSTIATAFEAFAADVIEQVKEEAVELAVEVAGDIEKSFEDLVDRLGGTATRFVAVLMNDDTLKGIEKANLAATQLVEEATSQGITLAAHDATALIKSGYVAVMDQLGKIKA